MQTVQKEERTLLVQIRGFVNTHVIYIDENTTIGQQLETKFGKFFYKRLSCRGYTLNRDETVMHLGEFSTIYVD